MDRIYIKDIIQKVLNKSFSSTSKRKISEYEDRLNIACPYCGDSDNEYKKRGNLYLNKLFYICFNCEKKTTLDKISKDFNEPIDPDKKLEIINYLNSVADHPATDNQMSDIGFSNLVDIKDLEDAFNVRKVSPIFDFSPIIKGGGIYKYLIGRGIPDDLHGNIYQAKFEKGDDNFDHIIVLLNRVGDKVLGLQVRNLKGGRNRFFLIYNWESIYTWVHGQNIDVDPDKITIYNKMSYYFNILNVNFDYTITVFEGYLDSLFYPNSIGIVGTNTDLRMLESNNLDIQYFFDNDIAGFKKSEEKIREGSRVFLWNKLFEDIVNRKKDKDPDKILYRISKVKDMNKLNELVPNAYAKLNLKEFFSEDILDIKWIPKTKSSKYY